MADQIGTTYNMPQMIRISGGIDTAKAREAFSEIIRRHAILRTDFSMIDGRFVQTVHDSVPIDMSEASAAQSEIAERFQRFIRRFDLGHAPLLRLGALCDKLVDQGCYVIISNNDTSYVGQVFSPEKYEYIRILGRRMINNTSEKRHGVDEVILIGRKR
jgi:hypothetical protein